MCKIFVINEMDKVKNVKETIETINDYITKSERDGFGYTIQGSSGLFGERTLEPNYFDFDFDRPQFSAPWLESDSNKFGKFSRPIGAGLFHGRTSTNHVNIENTHPIVKNQWHVIHNGVVDNIGPDYKMTTTTDSEHIAHYLSESGIESVEKFLTGYYAFAALDPHGRLHIVRDTIAELHSCYCSTIDSMLFATTPQLIQSIAKDLEWTISNISKVIDNQHLIFEKGKLINQSTIKSLGWNDKQAKKMGQSLSYLDDEYYSDFSGIKSNDSITQNYIDLVDYDSDSFKYYLREIEQIDSTYSVTDYYDRHMELNEFMQLSIDEQIECIVRRSDGTIVSPVDYFDDKMTA